MSDRDEKQRYEGNEREFTRTREPNDEANKGASGQAADAPPSEDNARAVGDVDPADEKGENEATEGAAGGDTALGSSNASNASSESVADATGDAPVGNGVEQEPQAEVERGGINDSRAYDAPASRR